MIDVSTVLAIDVGNTNIVVGAYDKERLIRTWRLVFKPEALHDEHFEQKAME